MKQLDVYYRALLEYREQTQQNKQCVSDSRSVIKANTDLDKIVLTRKHCIVDEEWVDRIEEGLEYVAKAIAEERQFIYSQGETVEIEKVKTVSKDSVVHLAKHSNLITREIPGHDVIPDKLYTVEKLNDYAVYENKFLYLLLCYLRDFITIRYNKILELSNTYNGTMTMNKVVKTASRTMKYSVNFAEEKRDDDYLKETNQAKDIIERIDLLLKTVIAFFSTPLMQFVSKAPMIKPPITKTNVLKMNNNFKQALNLYGYVVSYDGDGYTVETEVRELSPFNDTVAEEMAETILLSSFLTYEHSLGIEADLKREYEREEQRRKESALKEFREKIEAARLKVQKSEMSMEEYIVMLEKHLRALEKKAKELDKVKKELEETKALLEQTIQENNELKITLENTIKELEAEKLRYITDMAALKLAHEEEMKTLVTDYEEKIAEIIANHENEIRELKEEHEKEINDLNEEHANRITALNEEHANQITALKEEHENQITAINEEHEKRITTLNEDHEKQITDLKDRLEGEISTRDSEIASLKEKMAADRKAYEEEILQRKTEYADSVSMITAQKTELSAKLEMEILERRYLKAQYLALKQETGRVVSEDDHLTQLKFDELQHTFEVFEAFYKQEWEKAKRHIRHDIFKKIRRKSQSENSTEPISESELKAEDSSSLHNVIAEEQIAVPEDQLAAHAEQVAGSDDQVNGPAETGEAPEEFIAASAEQAETPEENTATSEEQEAVRDVQEIPSEIEAVENLAAENEESDDK